MMKKNNPKELPVAEQVLVSALRSPVPCIAVSAAPT
jgi:hypothetical protein